MNQPRDEIEEVRRDLVRHGESISSLVTDAYNTKQELWEVRSGIERERAVRLIKDEHLDERLDVIEKSISKVYTLGLWSLGTFGSAVLVGLANFVIKGGLVAH